MNNDTMRLGKPPSRHTTEIMLRCNMTGITSTLLMEGLPPTLVLDYIHPLAHYSNASRIAGLELSVLSKLSSEVLAGIVLTMYKHFDLLSDHQDAFISNSILRTAGIKNLIQAVQLSVCFSKINTKHLPHFSLDYATHKNFISIGDAFAVRLAEWRSSIYKGDTSKDINVAIANAMERRGKGRIDSRTLSDYERNFEKNLIDYRREVKDLLIKMQAALKHTGFEKLHNFLKLSCAGRNLVAMDKATRAKVLTRLEEAQLKMPSEFSSDINKLAYIVQETENPYDIFAKADDHLERASDIFTKPTTKKTIQEIIAEKREKEARAATAQGEAASAHQQAIIDVSPYIEAKHKLVVSDIEDNLELLQALEEQHAESEQEDSSEDAPLFDNSTDNEIDCLFDSQEKHHDL